MQFLDKIVINKIEQNTFETQTGQQVGKEDGTTPLSKAEQWNTGVSSTKVEGFLKAFVCVLLFYITMTAFILGRKRMGGDRSVWRPLLSLNN